MNGDLVILAGLGIGVVAFVVAPLLRRHIDATEDPAAESLSRSRELHSRQEMLLSSLNDLEDDLATHKIDEEDYRGLHGRLSNEAVTVMRELDGLEEERDRVEEREQARRTLHYPGPRPTDTRRDRSNDSSE